MTAANLCLEAVAVSSLQCMYVIKLLLEARSFFVDNYVMLKVCLHFLKLVEIYTCQFDWHKI